MEVVDLRNEVYGQLSLRDFPLSAPSPSRLQVVNDADVDCNAQSTPRVLVQSTPRGALGTTSSAATVNRIGSSLILYDVNAQGFFKRESQGTSRRAH